MQDISLYSLLKQLSLKNIIRNYFEKEKSQDKIFEKESENLVKNIIRNYFEKEESQDKIFKKKSENLANSYEN